MRTILIFLSLLFIFPSCSPNAPSNKNIRDMIYGLYLREATIISKEACENSDLWLVYFRYKGDIRPYGYLIEISPDGALRPFNMPIPNATCPK